LFALQGDFFADVPADLAAILKMVEDLRVAPDAAAIHERIEAIYLKVHSIAAKAGLAGLPVAARLGAVLEALLTKLYGSPNAITASTLNTVENALRLLESLCTRGMDEKLASHPPIRTLVADDEPLARRAIMGALQLAFDKPDGAETGAEACVLAAQKPYDVIFTDVQMPLMDGFALCRDVRAGNTNRDTPIVVVTSHNDDANQARAFATGANDFIGKPFLPIEIAVKALTLAWNARLRKLGVTPTTASSGGAAAEARQGVGAPVEAAPV
jgi:CheY-like chemotaxis protein